MDERTGVFRVYRVVDAVPPSICSTPMQRGSTPCTSPATANDSRQLTTSEQVISSRRRSAAIPTTGGSLALLSFDRRDRVAMDFVVDAEVPEVAAVLWEPGLERPASAVLEEDGKPVAECTCSRARRCPAARSSRACSPSRPMESLLTELPVSATRRQTLFSSSLTRPS